MRELIFSVVLLASIVFFLFNSIRLYRYLAIGKPVDRFGEPGRRLLNVLVVAFGQKKLLREPFAGLMHFFIFWGFVILLSAVAEAIVEGVYPPFNLAELGPLYPVLAFLQEVVGILVLAAVLMGFVRWYVIPPQRYYGPEIGSHVRLDATFILSLIFVIITSTFGTSATRIVVSGEDVPARFVSTQLATLLASPGGAEIWHEVFWWIHILVILGFLNYLPFSKHLHVLTSIPNVYFSSLEPKGSLTSLNLEDESAEKFGAEDVSDLTWKQLLDGYTCTDCGRCTAACPANITGKPLSPRKIIMNIRDRTMHLAPIMLTDGDGADREQVLGNRLLGNYVTEEELWACTTCRACMEECPVMIEHIPAILDMRRYLVLTDSRFPSELTATFKNLETNFSPWAFSHETRADWAKDLDIRHMADVEAEVDVLYWVGCAGSYDARYQKVSRAMAQIMNTAGVDFAILGQEEKCNGDPARRGGNEYLAQLLIAENVETLKKYRFRRIVASCPHCFNTLKNEYPHFGASYDVVHHTTFLHELLQQGRIRLSRKGRETLVFHDSCYLGRYNGIYDEPRELLRASGSSVKKMNRARDRGFCCGAGGARMFMEETIGKRVNVERTEEALALDAGTIATACPFCMTMLTDGLKAKDADEQVKVEDVAEIVAASLL